MSMRQPVLFISHGAPSMVLDDRPATRFLKDLGRQLPRPTAVLCISAHWETTYPCVSAHPQPPTIHDFYGFPEALYRLHYPAPGAVTLAERLHKGIASPQIGIDPGRGLDHGAWAPMMLLFPAADIPTVQLSVQPTTSPVHHYALGAALAGLRDEGVLILASGAVTHNLRDFGHYPQDAPAVDYALAFDEWLAIAIETGNLEDLLDYRQRAPHAACNHPTPEHLLPLFVALGATTPEENGHRLHASFEYGFLSMANFAWGL